MLDRPVVPFQRPSLGLLVAPVELGQQARHVRGVIADTELALEHRGDSPCGPQIVRVAVALGSDRKDLREPLTLSLGQPPWASRRWPGSKALVALLLPVLTPQPNGADRRADHSCHRRQRVARLQKPHRPPSTPLQLHRTSPWSHGSVVPQEALTFYYLRNDQ
jgi:hypothetical protein